MATTENVRVLRIVGKTEGLAEMESRLRGVKAAQDNVAQSSNALATATETATRRQLSASASWDRLIQKYDAARPCPSPVRARDAHGESCAGNRPDLHGELRSHHGSHQARFRVGSVLQPAYRDGRAGKRNTRQVRWARAARVGEPVAPGAGHRRLARRWTVTVHGPDPAGLTGRGHLRLKPGHLRRIRGSGRKRRAEGGDVVRWHRHRSRGGGGRVGYLGLQYANTQREIERSINGIGAASGATVASINAVAERRRGISGSPSPPLARSPRATRAWASRHRRSPASQVSRETSPLRLAPRT